MAKHKNKNSMLTESLPEMIAIADYCLKTKKDKGFFGNDGYYGFPAAILLLSVVDAIGAHTNGSKKKHFNVLNNKEFFGLNLKKESIDTLYSDYRCMLAHEIALEPGCILRMGTETNPPFEISTNRKISALNLLPLLNLTKKATNIFVSKLF